MSRTTANGFLCALAVFAIQVCAQSTTRPSFSLDVIQGGWWSDCNAPAVEFLIRGSQYSGDFAGTYTLTLNGDILIFTDGLIDGHSINVTHKPLSFKILTVTHKELVLRPLPGNRYVGDWHLQSCK
jgi:hypothetical protein